MTRNGKIARLPDNIRTQLNQRLQDGEQGKVLVQWLNTLPEVQNVMTRDFAAHPITEQNLSEWKRGGYPEWQRRQSVCDEIRAIVTPAGVLTETFGSSTIAGRLAAVLTAELAAETRLLLAKSSDPKERCHVLCESLRTLSELHYRSAAAAHGAAAIQATALPNSSHPQA